MPEAPAGTNSSDRACRPCPGRCRFARLLWAWRVKNSRTRCLPFGWAILGQQWRSKGEYSRYGAARKAFALAQPRPLTVGGSGGTAYWPPWRRCPWRHEVFLRARSISHLCGAGFLRCGAQRPTTPQKAPRQSRKFLLLPFRFRGGD